MSTIIDPLFLEILRIIIFVGLLTFSASYLVPKGIVALKRWKKSENFNDLRDSILALTVGIFLLLFLLYNFVFTSWV